MGLLSDFGDWECILVIFDDKNAEIESKITDLEFPKSGE